MINVRWLMSKIGKSFDAAFWNVRFPFIVFTIAEVRRQHAINAVAYDEKSQVVLEHDYDPEFGWILVKVSLELGHTSYSKI